ncbi:hypothetical protein [Candidatus Phycosocius spiralis]|uniref:Uncharacterized protein n=1 Tax=Candidatus Phycosocius spiralis TaxID=2815099 RepID=A0ABQ4PTZ6_9PROT|nr:hypothetical protein [Candidatus Phycosocius spiralis]GIU66487.1 hypothetical protein PsB1_0641 [Candidatus Phycosocius spiralis]
MTRSCDGATFIKKFRPSRQKQGDQDWFDPLAAEEGSSMVAAEIQAATPKMRAKSRSNTKATTVPEAEKLRPPPLALTLA